MKKFRLLTLLFLILVLYSCSTLKEGFINPKKDSSDEFLVEKKSPLVMPPDFDELPLPNSNTDQNLSEESNIKDLVTSNNENNSQIQNSEDLDKNFEDNLLEKIKKN